MATNVPIQEKTLTDLLKDIARSIQDIIRSEVKLAKAEAQETLSKLWTPARLIALGSLAGLYGLGFLLLSGVRALGLVLPDWAASACVGAALGVMALFLISVGRRKFKRDSQEMMRVLASKG